MILNKTLKIKGHPRNIEFYRKKGYDIAVGKLIDVSYVDVSSGCTAIISYSCDNCASVKTSEYREYYNYTKANSENYYCNSCKCIKYKNTCLERYGVDNPMRDPNVKSRLKNSIIEKYGVEHYSKTSAYKETYKNTCLEKYGFDNVSKTPVVKKIISDIKYNFYNSVESYSERISKEYDIINYSNRTFTLLHKRCGENFNIFINTLNDRLKNDNILCIVCNPIDKLSSGRELELKNFLLDNNINFIENSYEVIKPLSLDVYLPTCNIAIEFNGVYWHSDVYKHKDYHINKTNLCNDIGIELLHIWEDDWLYKKDIIKSMILNKISNLSNKIYARKCKLKIVSDIKIIREFLDKNHIQGYSNSSIKIGLYYDDELVSLMIFGKKRTNMELIRFCTKIGYNVIGGASKLFRYFITQYNYDDIVSYSDISFFSGRMYEMLNFKMCDVTPPNYWWVVDGIRKHRFNFNKKKLVRNNIEHIGKSESEIMREMGYNKLWGCGLKKWKFNRY